jgi:hypothetical protein
LKKTGVRITSIMKKGVSEISIAGDLLKPAKQEVFRRTFKKLLGWD